MPLTHNNTLPRLVRAIVEEWTHLTRFSVKVGKTRFLGKFYEDNDDKDYTT